MQTTRAFVAFAIVWVILALATLSLVVHNDDSLLAAIIAWVGGVLTYPLAVESWRRLKA